MIFKKTKISGVFVIKPEIKEDERGWFTRTFCQDEFEKNDIDFPIVQVNRSFTKKKGTIRGLHFQVAPKEEGKIVHCLRGSIYDVALDLRKGSETYGQWHAEELTENNRKMLFTPKGVAHGLQTLEDGCVIQYFMSEFYSSEHSSGARWDDPFFNIKWPLTPTAISEKDKNWPLIQK